MTAISREPEPTRLTNLLSTADTHVRLAQHAVSRNTPEDARIHIERAITLLQEAEAQLGQQAEETEG